jgi:hypothetical protein
MDAVFRPHPSGARAANPVTILPRQSHLHDASLPKRQTKTILRTLRPPESLPPEPASLSQSSWQEKARAAADEAAARRDPRALLTYEQGLLEAELTIRIAREALRQAQW